VVLVLVLQLRLRLRLKLNEFICSNERRVSDSARRPRLGWCAPRRDPDPAWWVRGFFLWVQGCKRCVGFVGLRRCVSWVVSLWRRVVWCGGAVRVGLAGIFDDACGLVSCVRWRWRWRFVDCGFLTEVVW
jgi:hypothetical protein